MGPALVVVNGKKKEEKRCGKGQRTRFDVVCYLILSGSGTEHLIP